MLKGKVLKCFSKHAKGCHTYEKAIKIPGDDITRDRNRHYYFLNGEE